MRSRYLCDIQQNHVPESIERYFVFGFRIDSFPMIFLCVSQVCGRRWHWKMILTCIWKWMVISFNQLSDELGGHANGRHARVESMNNFYRKQQVIDHWSRWDSRNDQATNKKSVLNAFSKSWKFRMQRANGCFCCDTINVLMDRCTLTAILMPEAGMLPKKESEPTLRCFPKENILKN